MPDGPDKPAPAERHAVRDTSVAVRDTASENLSRQTDMRNFSQLTGADAPKPDVVQNGAINFGNFHDVYGINADVASPLKPASKLELAAAAPSDAAALRPGAPTTDRVTTISDNSGPGVNQADIQTQKTRLEQLTQGMSPDQAAEARKDMAAIEHRQPPLTADQINSIYDSTSKLMENRDNNSPLSQPERAQLAASILHNASLRHEIDQGFHNTCNITTIEERLNVTNPAEAARLVSEVGLTGQYKSKDGQIIKLDQASLHADGEARLAFGDSRTDGKRDYASQVFDMATINDYWQHQKPPLSYSQVTPTGQSDTGERLTYANGKEVLGPDGKPMRQPALTLEAMGQIGKSLGMDGQYIISNERANGGPTSDIAKTVGTYQDFQDALSKGQSSSIVFVNTNDKLFGGTGDQGGAGGWHVVNVSDYKAGPPPQVFMTNQWGSGNNKWVNVSDLYNATLPPGSSGRVNDQGGDQGQGQGDSQGGGQRQGWTRNDGVMKDDSQYKQWRQDLFDNYWKDSDQNPLKKNPTLDPQAQIAPLQSMLADARARHDDLTINMIEYEINNIKANIGK